MIYEIGPLKLGATMKYLTFYRISIVYCWNKRDYRNKRIWNSRSVRTVLVLSFYHNDKS